MRKTINDRISRVRVVHSDKEANALIAAGWRPYGMPAWADSIQSPVFVLAWLEPEDEECQPTA